MEAETRSPTDEAAIKPGSDEYIVEYYELNDQDFLPREIPIKVSDIKNISFYVYELIGDDIVITNVRRAGNILKG